MTTPRTTWLAWPARHPLATCLLATLALILCALSLSRMRPDASLAGMFPKNDPAATSLVHVLDHFSAVEELLVLVSTPESQRNSPPNPDQLLSFAKRLDSAVQSSPQASSLTAGVLYQADEETRSFFEKVLVPNALFYLDDASFRAAQQRLTRPEMEKQIRQNEALISAPGPAAQAMAKAFLQDPLRLHEFILSRLTESRPFKTYHNSDAFLSPDGYSLLIRVRGNHPPSDIDYSTSITNTIQSLADRVNTDHLQIELTGAYAIAATSAGAIRHDMIANITSSVILLQLLFLLAYRRPFRLFALAFGPVVAGVVWGLGLYVLASPSITPLTAVVGGILAGMGIDYSIQYLSHFLSRRSAGLTPLAAAEDTSRTLGRPMFAAFLTSVVGFAAVASSSVPALRNFATVGTLGLAGAFAAAIFLLPALLVLLSRTRSPQWQSPGIAIPGSPSSPVPQERAPSPEQDPKHPFSPSTLPFRLPINPLLLLISRHRRTTITLSSLLFLAATAVLCWPGQLLPLESDLTVMHPSPNPALAAQTHLAQRMGTSPDSLIIHLRSDSPAHLQSLAHQVESRLHSPAARTDAGVTGTYGLATLLPDPSLAPARLAATGPAVADRVVADFRAALADSIFSPDAFDPCATFLRHILTRPAPPTTADLLRFPRLAETILPTSALEHATPPTESITLVFVKDPLTSRADRDRVIHSLRALLSDLPGVTLTGMTVVAQDTESTIRHDLPRFLWIAIAIVAAYLLLHFRSLTPALLAVLPTLFSLACLLAVMRVAGLKLNMINLVAMPILIGIDVDYGIFLVSIARQRHPRETLPQFISRVTPSCHAIIMCAATTVLGFGSLAFTTVPAIRSLGYAVIIGVTSCLLATFLLLIPLLAHTPTRAEPPP